MRRNIPHDSFEDPLRIPRIFEDFDLVNDSDDLVSLDMSKQAYEILPVSRTNTGTEKNRRFGIFTKLALGLVIISIYQCISSLWNVSSFKNDTLHKQTIFSKHAQDPLKRAFKTCDRIKKPFLNITDATLRASERTKNPRAVKGDPLIVIHNARVITGDPNEYPAPWGQIPVGVAIYKGIIQYIGPLDEMPTHLIINDPVRVDIDAQGRYLTPGLFDLHSHAGVDSLPYLRGTADTNEITSPVTNYVRVIDAFNPSDPALTIIASGGVTTSLILPGSANNIGGEAIVIKHRPVSTISVEDMLVTAGESEDYAKHYRYMKMACGENPKNVYGRRLGDAPTIPYSRLGAGWVFREAFERARKLREQQDEWCDIAERYEIHDINSTMVGRLGKFPEELELESLVALLRGEVKLNIHCYETMDLEAMIRHSKEFNFPIAAFHHALDAYRIPDIIKRAKTNITAAIFSSHWGYKKEAYQASPFAAKILAENRIPVVLKSDHPVTNAQNLLFQAQEAHHFGLSEALAIAAVTSVPAKTAGLDYRIGYVRIGYDADLVLWNMHPLKLGATPDAVWIDGVPLFEIKKKEIEHEVDNPPEIAKGNLKKCDIKSTDSNSNSKSNSNSNILFENVNKIFYEPDSNLESSTTNISLLVKDGKISCLGEKSSCLQSLDFVPTNIDLEGKGYILPGLTVVGTRLGMWEIDQESTTGDGTVQEFDFTDSSKIPLAKDSLIFDGERLRRAHDSGVLNSITPPFSDFFIRGVSVTFSTGSQHVLELGAIAQDITALHVQIGTEFRNSKTRTIGLQIASLRQLLNLGKVNSSMPVYGKVALGEIPLALHTGNKDVIAKVLALKREFENEGGKLNLIIVGGEEAYLLADELSSLQVPVILHWRCMPESWETRHCLTGPPFQSFHAITILAKSHVKLGITIADDAMSHQLAWEAGWAKKVAGDAISEHEAVNMISYNIEKIFGVTKTTGLAMGKIAEFVVYDKSPFEFGSSILAIVENGKLTSSTNC